MKIDIPTKTMVKKMVDDQVRKEMYALNQMLNKIRKRLAELETKK